MRRERNDDGDEGFGEKRGVLISISENETEGRSRKQGVDGGGGSTSRNRTI